MLSFFLFFKVFIEFVTILLPFFFSLFWFFGPKACGVLAPWPGIEPTHPALEGEILTTGPPGKSSHVSLHAGGRGGLGYRRGEGNVVMKRATAMMRPGAEECHGILTLPAAGRSRELILPWSLQKESAVDTLILVLEDSFQTVCLQNYKRIYFCCFKPLFFFSIAMRNDHIVPSVWTALPPGDWMVASLTSFSTLLKYLPPSQ